MSRRRALAGMAVAAVLLLGAAPQASPPENAGAPEERPAPLHADVAALERAVVDATLAYVHSDCRAARAALDRIDAGCRRLSRDDTPKAPDDVIVYDETFHKTVDLAREFAAGEQLERSFDQFVWAQRACRLCHGQAQAAKLMPPHPPKPGP